MCCSPAFSQHVFTTYQTTFCEIPLPQTLPFRPTARKILPWVMQAAAVQWSRATLTQPGTGTVRM